MSAPSRTAVAPATGGASRSVKLGRVLSTLTVLFLAMDAGMKLAAIQPVTDSFVQLGWPNVPRSLGTLELLLVLLHVLPRTAVLGAVLLTGYLGGAVATHVRVGDPVFSHVLFPVYVGALLWGGLLLREGRLRELLPLRRSCGLAASC